MGNWNIFGHTLTDVHVAVALLSHSLFNSFNYINDFLKLYRILLYNILKYLFMYNKKMFTYLFTYFQNKRELQQNKGNITVP